METREFDVVVAGCGVAGLSAAVAARENGAKVAVLERSTREERGGQSRYTEAYLRMKSETEVTDDFEIMLAENGSGYVDPELVEEAAEGRSNLARSLAIADPTLLETFANAAGPTVAWLKGFGLRFDFLPTQFLTKSQPRLLPVGGGLALVEALAARAEKLGSGIPLRNDGDRTLRRRRGARHRLAREAPRRRCARAVGPRRARDRRLRG